METSNLIAAGEWRSCYGTPIQHGDALFVRLFKRDSESHHEKARIAVFKSVDAGATWTELPGGPAVRFGFNFFPGSGAVHGGVLYISYNRMDRQNGTSDDSRLCVARFDMASETWLEDWTGPALRYSPRNQIGVRSDGSLVIQYLHQETYPYRRKWRCVTVSPEGVFGEPLDLTDWQTWLNFAYDRAGASVPIAADDSATLAYRRSRSGSWDVDHEKVVRRLDTDGTLGPEYVVMELRATVHDTAAGVVLVQTAEAR